MSDDDKKRDRALQRRVRERMAKTGESYQAAWRQLTGSEGPPEEPALDPREELPSLPEEFIQIAAAAGIKVVPIARGKAPNADPSTTEELQHASPGQRAAADDAAANTRLVLPLASHAQTPPIQRVPPHQRTRIIARPANGALDLTNIHISGAGTPNGAADWIVNDIEVDGRSQLAQKDLTGALFGSSGVAATPRAWTTLSLKGFTPVERGCELAVVVTYVGPNPEGVPFFAAVTGLRPPQRPTVIPIETTTPLPLSTKKTITAHVENAPFQINRIEIESGWDWIVNDVRINGRSQFVQSGDIPGDMFGTDAIDAFVQMETCTPGGTVELDVTYIGAEQGAKLRANLEGTVKRDDYSTPPPDLHVVIAMTDQASHAVIATCNWRQPAVSNHAP